MFELYFTSAIIVFMTFALIKELHKPSVIVFGALIFLHIGGVLSLDETFTGFSNHGMLTVGVLFVVAGALQSATSFGNTIEKILGKKKSKSIYFRLMFPVSFLSAFLNNTPIVASLIPVLKRWTKKNDLPVSKFLIPLSYAAILGGTCTLIGTSTNLVIHGLLLDHGMEGFSFFEIGKVGLPVALFSIFYFSLGGHFLLPKREDTISQFGENMREFMVEMKVHEEFPHLGKSIEDANLRHLKGLYLFQIIRDEVEIAPVSPKEKIFLNDTLFFIGLPDTIFELQKTSGLHIIKDIEFDLKNIDSDKLKTYEAVISNSSPLIGQTVRESGFRTKYDAVILGIHRTGKRISKKVGDIELQPNDTLFILAKKYFDRKWYNSHDFSLVSLSVDEYSKPKRKGNIALILMGLMVFAVATGLVKSMLIAASVTAGIMLLCKILSLRDAKKFIDFDVILVIASAFGIGKAIENAGIADLIANYLINSLDTFGIIGIIAGVFFITSIYTEFITNNAAAALMFPVALAIANKMGLDPKPIMITIAIAASSSFATPLGYQTNLMVYNPGGYKFTDFIKTGLIMNIMVGIIATLVVYFLFYV